ncbi:lyase family protein [Flavisphingomonas formosensis]|uniref:lyase family protein n=1 Tax=Flavisphingomonas formosensis TaxID=861534 RepID=UPI0012F9C731|nr:lyase family protein [Sphingomonas formosensis]
MSDWLRSRPAATPAMLAIFADDRTIGHALAFEAALAAAEAAEGLIDRASADAIGAACRSLVLDPAALAEEAALAGTLAIPLVKHLRAALAGPAAEAVHRGATSQDLADTVLMLQLREAAALLAADLARIVAALDHQARRHADTPALGRTLLQDALPIGFGLRLAQGAAGVADGARRIEAEVAAHAVLQFGGAAGTRAGLAGSGEAIARRLATALGLPAAPPWHARRGGIAGIAGALGITIGALGKVARDVTLLAQNMIGEAREPAIAGRGGSSAMAHKRNPTGCQVALSAALRAPGLVAGILAGLPAEEERGIGGWQAEGPAIADLFLLAAGSADALATVTEGLEIDEAAIARNLAASGLGTDIGESAAIVAQLLGSENAGREED